ncbi:Hint domain-containing protein [Aliiruegeria haliotis]|uniref:Hint domain-containing protein n=1 Tax=Aliiruegeria haliotis TaxID=1280846 RepID=A0A2T0RKV0_9RHOB|nr:Hint domain-containing protein [Aliiruegeria haliotis]PRY21826.1 Hint domain-containing protein [Aliiruegeria haliotis]
MMTPRQPVAAIATDLAGETPATADRTVRPDRQTQRVQSLTRRYEVLYLNALGDVEDMTRVAPATPVFEDAFAALARGTLISTVHGPVAVEDLLPGTLVDTVENGPQMLLWVGSMTVYPETAEVQGGEAARLTRLATDAFGLGRPMPDLMLGPRARVLYRNSRCVELLGTNQAFAPARGFVDGVSVIEVAPVSPVRVFHLGFRGQQILLANGMEVESYHPGSQIEAVMDRNSRDLFLSLFPHVSGLEDFGPMHTPRLTAFELENLRLA